MCRNRRIRNACSAISQTRKGNKVIFATSFGYQDFALKVAKDFPDTTFLTATGFKKAKDFGTYNVRLYQARIPRASRRAM